MALVLAPYGGGTLIGSIGSTTFQRGRYGNLARQRVAPVNPNTPRQVATRAALTAISQFWSTTLSTAQVAAWNAYAAATPLVPSNTILTGQAMFIRTLFLPVYAGAPAVPQVDAPILPLEAALPNATFTLVAATGVLSLTGMLPAPTTDELFLLQTSIPYGQGKNFFKGPFQFQQIFYQTTAFPWVLHTYGTLAVGTKVWVKRRCWDPGENKTSPMEIVQITAV